MSNIYYSVEFKYEVIMAYKSGEYSFSEIFSNYKINKNTLYRWIEKFDRYGKEGLADSRTWKRYSKELKVAAVKDYLSGEYSQNEVLRKYDISSSGVFHRWIKKYNGHRELKDTGKGRTSSMTKGRKTTLNERIEIVQDALGNGKNYQDTAEKHQVSYQQVYQWVRKYEDGGWDALKDRRGRSKNEEELTSEEKMKLEIRRIEKENERLRAENAFLKKLEEIERRRK
ncbi:helix-turn-helix domain-containing protein [Oceanobacillus luteolus]|uniref:helix-turn-helix domain-containing protein n=1 Tax=Oceanobacillus luteolus TaxID=1274358 RepID=UPI00203DE2D9|nr:helix-turn-helix domain-containing protein [Oceanobacillus luteolus]MCM3741761.1 helix-turn-helix domain-containing protein [Oceanobacillus luteolus]